MCRCPFLIIGLLLAATQAFELAPIRWAGLQSQKLLIAPSPRASVPLRKGASAKGAAPQTLKLWNPPSTMSPSEYPYFAVKPDDTIHLDDSGLCIEASAARSGDVCVSGCHGGPSQQWHFLPTGSIQLKGTNQCMDIPNIEGDLDGSIIVLRECGNKKSETWKFEDPNIPSTWPYVLQMLMGLLILGALVWQRQQRRALLTVPTSRTIMDQGGIYLSEPWAVSQGAKMTPAVKAVSPVRNGKPDWSSPLQVAPEVNCETTASPWMVPAIMVVGSDSAKSPAQRSGLAKRKTSIRPASVDDAKAIADLVNEAFTADTFFKNPKFYERLAQDGSDVFSDGGSDENDKETKTTFLLCEDTETKERLGTVKVEIEIGKEIAASFGMLSVPERNGGRGIGSALVRAVEEFVKQRAVEEFATGKFDKTRLVLNRSGNTGSYSYDTSTPTSIHLTMPLISVRRDLFPFYKRLGYAPVTDDSDVRDLPSELDGMVSAEYEGKVGFVWYGKELFVAQ